MPNKDYYAILMVHPKAEAFLIEAAYKRLARAYHPDVSTAPDKHEKMVDINAAYEVLSEPARRKIYDQECARQASYSSTVSDSVRPQNTASAPNPLTESKLGVVPPVIPDPTSFGIYAGYLEHAIAGSHEWNIRKRRFSGNGKWAIRCACGTAWIAILSMLTPNLDLTILVWWWLVAAILVGEIPIKIFERSYDARLKRTLFDPYYNPNPSGYSKYAIEYAKYESEVAQVYVSRRWIYHSSSFCGDMSNSYIMPKWEAVARNASRCFRCGYFSIRPKRLPPPFGRG